MKIKKTIQWILLIVAFVAITTLFCYELVFTNYPM